MFDGYLPTRKKIRGWKRRIRQIDRWGEWIKSPDLKYFEKSGYTYERCTLSPFYMIVRRNPPLWFYKLIVSKFITAYKIWAVELDQTGIPYDLMLWLYDPAFIQSEIISYKVEHEGDRARFSWESDVQKPFPYSKFNHPLYNLNEFEWMLADDENVTFLSEMDEKSDLDWYINNGYVKKVQKEGEIYYAKRTGNIWMGRLKR